MRLADRCGDIVGAVIVALGASLRLWRIDQGDFLLDQAGYYSIAQNALANRALPAAGVSSSIGTLTQPAAIYFYLPFVFLRDPAIGMYATALANVVALGLTYRLAGRYFGSAAAIVSTLLFAVGAHAVQFSRNIWQQNLLPPVVLALFALTLAGAQRGRSGWFGWALPVWGLAVQLHPTAAPLIALLAISWALAPNTVRSRDVAIGSVGFIAVYVPTILWEVASEYLSMRAFAAYLRRPAATDLEVVRNLIGLLDLPSWFAGHWTAIGVAAGKISIALPMVGVLYLAWHVSAQALGGVWRSLRAWPTWARAPAQAQWRGELLLLAWLFVTLVSQLRHHSPVFVFYLLAVLPAAYLAAGVIVERIFQAARAARDASSVGRRLTWHVGAGLAGTLVVASACAQVYATPGVQTNGVAAFPLRAWKEGLARATDLARANRVSLAVIQTDYFTVDAAVYLLNNGFDLGVATHLAGTRTPESSVRCLNGPPGGPLLYVVARLKTEVDSPAEAYVRRELGAVEVLGGMAGSGVFRGYVGSLPGIDRPGGEKKNGGPERLHVEFGDEMVLRRIWPTQLPEGGRWLVLGFELTKPISGRDYGNFYKIVAARSDRGGEDLRRDVVECYGTPWIAGQQLLVFLPDVDQRVAGRGTQLRVAVDGGRAGPYPSRLGSIRLESILGAPSGHYFRATESAALLPRHCQGLSARCANGAVVVDLGSKEDRDGQPMAGGVR
jgi:hypothetical protein